MADLKTMRTIEGISEGISSGIENYLKIIQLKNSLKNNKEIEDMKKKKFDIDYKLQEKQLQGLELENKMEQEKYVQEKQRNTDRATWAEQNQGTQGGGVTGMFGKSISVNPYDHDTQKQYMTEVRAQEDQARENFKFQQDQADRVTQVAKEEEEAEFKKWERDVKIQKFDDYLEEQSQKETEDRDKDLKYTAEQIYKNFPKSIEGNYTITKDSVLETPELGQEFLDYIGYKEGTTKTVEKKWARDEIIETPESMPKVNSATIWKFLKEKTDKKKTQSKSSGYKAGETREINGITYTRNEQGAWVSK